MSKVVRTRFAPSPTGLLHVGGVRTALYNYLLAKQTGGNFILRLEDTDRERYEAAGIDQIVAGLDWLSLVPDEGFWISDNQHQNISYVQSERHKTGLYQKYAKQLVDRGLAYYSYVTNNDYDSLKQHAIKIGKPFTYRKHMESEYHDGLRQKPAGDYPIRLDIVAVKDFLQKQISQWDGTLSWTDKVHGEFAENLELIEDFILMKSDTFPTYNFANVIDDHEMRITHIIRGDEFIASTGKHALLYDLFGWDRPTFVHLSVINGSDGKKLSKRTGDTNVLDYKDKGYLPEALINFLALLGWNDGTEQEIFTRTELIKKFSLGRINLSPAIFDQQRLDWMNGHWIRQLSIDDLYERVKTFWPKSATAFSEAYKKQVLGLVQERLKYLAELPKLTSFFFADLPVELKLIDNNKQLRGHSHQQLASLLEKSLVRLEQSDFSVANLTQTLNDLLKETDERPAILFSLIRIATTWAPASPGLADTLSVLGKEKSLDRLKKSIVVLVR